MDARAHSAAIVRAGNRDRYLADLFAPEPVRGDLLALHAFDIEVSAIRDKVSDPTLGEIRLEWWRQAIRGDHGGNPVGAELAEAIARYRLPIEAFDDLIRARTFDLYDDPMPGMTELEGYAGDTVSAVMQLGAIMLAGGRDPGTAELAGYAGVAVGLANTLADLPRSSVRGQCLLPADRLAAHGASAADMRAGEASDGVRKTVGEVLALAAARLGEAQRCMAGIDPALVPAFLPAATAAPLLKRLARPGRDPLRDPVHLGPLRRQWAIWRAARRRNVL